MPWHYDKTCLRALQLFTVKVKWFLVLEMVATCVLMTPFVNVCYNGTVRAIWLEDIFWSGSNFLWAFMGLSVYNMVYPDHFPLWKEILAVLVAVALGWVPLTLVRECRGTLVSNLLPGLGTFFDNLSANIPVFKTGLLGHFAKFLQIALSMSCFFLFLVLYRGETSKIKHKAVFASAIAMPSMMILWGATPMLTESLRSLVSLGLVALIFIAFICAGVFGGHPIWAKSKVTKGPRYEFVGVMSYGFPLCPGGGVTLFLILYNSPQRTAWSRFVIYCGWRGFCFMVTWLFAKIACFGMRDDVQSLTILFGMVLTFQFATELIFIAIKPFGFEFFFMLFVKALLPILIKGGLIMDFHDFLKAKWTARFEKKKEKNPDAKESKIVTLFFKLLHSAGDRGPSYLHASDEQDSGRELLMFLTDLMYCDLSLLSRILCSIGCTTALGTELALRHFYPKTYRLGVWSAGIPSGTDHYMVFAAYGVVAFWNLTIYFVVMWLFSRKYVKFLGNFRVPHHEQNHWIKRFRSKMLSLHLLNVPPVGANGKRKIMPIDDKPSASIFSSGPASRSDSKTENLESVELLGKGPALRTPVSSGPASRSNSEIENLDMVEQLGKGPASRAPVVAKAEVASEVSSKEENHLDGVHKAPLDEDHPVLGITMAAAVVPEEKHSEVDGVEHASPVADGPVDEHSEGNIKHQKSNFELMDAAMKLFYKAKMNLHDFQTNFFHRQAFYVYFWTFAITYLTTVSVTYFQWRNFIAEDCDIDNTNITFQRALGEPYGVPLRIWNNNDTYTNRTICKMYSDPANITTANEPFSKYECWAYYSQYTVYTYST